MAVSVGNEATVEWTDHLVPVEKLIAYVQRIKGAIGHPVTFCENYVPWTHKLEPLAAELDFISLHSYPAWEYRAVQEALEYTKQNYYSVADHYPGQARDHHRGRLDHGLEWPGDRASQRFPGIAGDLLP